MSESSTIQKNIDRRVSDLNYQVVGKKEDLLLKNNNY